ncbi:hypothetical protein HOD83_00310 [Candidatus Woesearchaeota archaeon]|nr:hypothetical protein [Candidatus Woesearchaeota archaeon]MBT4114638.1 hypothetical protein [Candidatus Woesearchaeota archaeon]MBT4248020.1 hypothetical protein [Candidatus Woesearchaeota archaeon]
MINLRSIRVGLDKNAEFFSEEQASDYFSSEIAPRAESFQQLAEGLLALIDVEEQLGIPLDTLWYANKLKLIQDERGKWYDWVSDREIEAIAERKQDILERVEREKQQVSPRIRIKPIDYRTAIKPIDYRNLIRPKGAVPRDPEDAARFNELKKIKARL